MPAVYMHDAGLFLRHTLRTGTAVGNTLTGQFRPKHPSPILLPWARRDRLKLIPGASGRNRPRGREGTLAGGCLLLTRLARPINWDPFTLSGI